MVQRTLIFGAGAGALQPRAAVVIAVLLIAALVWAVAFYAVQKKRLDKFAEYLKTAAGSPSSPHGGMPPIPADAVPRGLGGLASSIDALAARIRSGHPPDTGASERRHELNAAILEDLCTIYTSIDCLQALAVRLGEDLSFDRVSVIEKSGDLGDPMAVAFWQRDEKVEYVPLDSVMAAVFNDALSAAAAAADCEIVDLGTPGRPPDTQTMFMVKLLSRGDTTAILLLESVYEDRQLSPFDNESIIFVSAMLKNLLLRHHMDMRRADFTASIEDGSRLIAKESGAAFVMPPMPSKNERIRNGNEDALRRRLQTIYLQLENCEGMSAALGSLRADTYGAELDRLLTDACAHMSLYEYSHAKDVVADALELLNTGE